jgi:hypothetical protein
MGPESPEMTSPKALRDLLMLIASFILSPCTKTSARATAHAFPESELRRRRRCCLCPWLCGAA